MSLKNNTSQSKQETKSGIGTKLIFQKAFEDVKLLLCFMGTNLCKF